MANAAALSVGTFAADIVLAIGVIAALRMTEKCALRLMSLI
jgi:hypothetical protein